MSGTGWQERARRRGRRAVVGPGAALALLGFALLLNLRSRSRLCGLRPSWASAASARRRPSACVTGGLSAGAGWSGRPSAGAGWSSGVCAGGCGWGSGSGSGVGRRRRRRRRLRVAAPGTARAHRRGCPRGRGRASRRTRRTGPVRRWRLRPPRRPRWRTPGAIDRTASAKSGGDEPREERAGVDHVVDARRLSRGGG